MRHLLDSGQIEKLFDPRSRDAQELLPHLVRRLVRETTSRSALLAIRIPVADDISTPGFDGVVEVSGSVGAHIPPGLSVWEASTGAAVDAFTTNYRKRQDQAASDTAFVFVTPHPWRDQKQLELLEEYRGKRDWRSVEILDALDLEEWLSTCLLTTRWLLGQFGVECGSFWDVGSYVKEEIDAKYGTGVASSLLVGGRSEEREELTVWLVSDSQRHRVIGDTVEEAAAFIAGVILDMGDEREYYESRVLFLRKPSVLSLLSTADLPYIIVPLAEDARKPAVGLREKGVRLLHPCRRTEREQVADKGETVLSTLRRESIEESLGAMGFQRETALGIARESKGSLLAVLWQIQDAGDVAQAWASPQAGEQLIPMLLGAEWEDGSEADWGLIGDLSGRSPDECRSIAKRWEWPAGPLIRRGSRWDWVAWPYAFRRLAQYIDRRAAEGFVETAVRVLSERDPALDMPTEDRWLANIHGKVTRNSPAVRSGLAASTALVAIHGDRMQGVNGQGIANRIVRDVLSVDPNGMAERWLSVSSVLGDLAEAAPDAFLECANHLVENEEAILEMFKEGGHLGGSSHTYLLWGAERLAWSSEYLTPVVQLLGALTERDPGGQLSNRPASSLAEILLGWHPNTTASVSERLDAIDVLSEAHGDVAWRICEELLSGRKTISSPTARPRWRSWDQEWRAPTWGEIWEYRDALADRLLTWVNGSAEKWAELVMSIGQLKGNAELQGKLAAGLRQVGSEPLSDDERASVSDALRNLTGRHRSHPEAEWALTEEELVPLSQLAEEFQPGDPIAGNRWLFQTLPEIPELERLEFRERFARIRAKRKEAVRTILEKKGLEGVLRAADEVESSSDVGLALADLEVAEEQELEFLRDALAHEQTESCTPKRLLAAWAYVGETYARLGGDWVNRVSADEGLRSGSSCLLNLALALPPSGETWDTIREWGDEIEDGYWRQTTVSVVREPKEDADRAIRSLLDVGRPYRALQVACLAEHRPKGDDTAPQCVSPGLLAEVLGSLATHPVDEESLAPDIGSISYYVERVFCLLDAASFDLVTVIQLEFALLPLLEDTERGPRQLLEAVKSSAWVFVELLKMVYRSEQDEEQRKKTEITERDRARARQAYRLLSNLREAPGTKWTRESDSDTLRGRFEGDISFPVGEMNWDEFTEWVERARALSEECGRLSMCDQQIGEILAYSPADESGLWPCELVRVTIERLRSQELERGIHTGVFNKRGVHFRPRGGELEWRIAERFSTLAEASQSKWPRTAAVLRGLAEDFEQHARREDTEGLADEFR